MSEQPDNAPRRVVRKVVKKTVVRPVAPSSPRSAGPLGGRPASTAVTGATSTRGTARLTTPARAKGSHALKPVAPSATTPRITPGLTAATSPQPAAAPRRRLPRLDVGGRVEDAVIGVR
ncbi:MAG TPA: hypothetical protein VJ782_03720, partial [Aeromicrobium sp.]|nr:hypothetical protein [Aeromicrobium sp.]